MYSSIRQFLFVCLLVATIGAGSHAFAFPTNVSITPPDDSRFLASQRFDIRVEGQGKGPFSATLMIDGVPHAFTSGVQNSNTTDGITVDGWGGFNLRGYSNRRAGIHTVKATFTDATGTITISAQFEIIDPVRKSNLNRSLSQRDETKAEQEINDLSQLAQARGQHAPIKNIIILLGDGMGVAHRTAARLVKYGVTAGRPNGFLAMDQFPGLGLVTTHSLNSIITDSAPGMAGYTTGSHFNNNQEGVNPAMLLIPSTIRESNTCLNTCIVSWANRSDWLRQRMSRMQHQQPMPCIPPIVAQALASAISTLMRATVVTPDNLARG